MKSLVLYVVIVILVRQSMSEWVLEWEDEFDNKAIDTNKWEIENESDPCNG
jgi:beta-glucanase (GH16 family)